MGILNFFSKKGKKSILEEIRKLAKNEIRIEPDEAVEAVRADGCKIGGKPYLPVDFVWPVFESKDDGVLRPLSFFCQIDLAEVKALDKDGLLPEKGLLSFFYECESFCWGFDPEDKGAARVFYFENTEGFVPCELPGELDEDYIMPELPVRFAAEDSYPGYEELEFHSKMDCEWEDYEDGLEKLGVNVEDDPEGHKLLGYADIIQNEMLTECERVTRGVYSGDPESYRNLSEDENVDILEKAKDWVLLLQLGTIEADGFEWMFGDCGMLYYYIRKQDLAEKRFENIWFSLQCG